jgi:hypothetical protein
MKVINEVYPKTILNKNKNLNKVHGKILIEFLFYLNNFIA